MSVDHFFDGLMVMGPRSADGGKSAYAYAVEGGYRGTEQEFAERLAFLMNGAVVGYVEGTQIVLSGDLAPGTYTFAYLVNNPDGTPETVTIGTYTVEENETGYTNLADPSDPYWKDGYKLSISGGDTDLSAGRTVTNFIPAKKDDTLYVKGLDITKTSDGQSSKIVKYKGNDESKVSGGAYGVNTNNSDSYGSMVVTEGDVQKIVLLEVNNGTNTMTDNITYIRLDGVLMDGYTSADVIITINEPIE